MTIVLVLACMWAATKLRHTVCEQLPTDFLWIYIRKGSGDLTCVTPKICDLGDAAIALNNQFGLKIRTIQIYFLSLFRIDHQMILNQKKLNTAYQFNVSDFTFVDKGKSFIHFAYLKCPKDDEKIAKRFFFSCRKKRGLSSWKFKGHIIIFIFFHLNYFFGFTFKNNISGDYNQKNVSPDTIKCMRPKVRRNRVANLG